MFRCVFAIASLCFSLNSFSQMLDDKKVKSAAAGCVDCFNFVAPSVVGAESVDPAELGLIVLDTQSGTFRGATSDGWQNIGDVASVNAAAGSSNVTLERSTSKKIQRFNPTSADMTVTLGNSYLLGDILTIKNYGTKRVIINSDAAAGIVPVYPGASLQFLSTKDSPSAAADWDVIGAVVSDWIEFPSVIDAVTTNPTKGTIDYDKSYWRRVGDSMQIKFSYRHTTAGTAGSGNYLIKLPAGYSMDTSKYGFNGGIDRNVVGNGGFGAGEKYGVVSAFDATSLVIVGSSPGDAGNVVWGSGVANHNLGSANVRMSLTATVAISGWTNSTGI